MKIMKILAVSLLVCVIGALVSDNVYLHLQMERKFAVTDVCRDVDQLKTKIQILEAKSSKIEEELNGFERWSVAADKNILGAVDKLEDWVATSSVQGKWNAYKRQLGDFETKMVSRYNQMKESIRQKLDAMTNEDSSAPPAAVRQ